MPSEGKQPVTVRDVARVTEGDAFGPSDAVVTDVTHDSRQANAGTLFAAIRGELFDAHKFIPQVMQQGALGVISELDPPADWTSLEKSQSERGLAPAAWLKVDNIRRAMALAAAEVHHHPSRE